MNYLLRKILANGGYMAPEDAPAGGGAAAPAAPDPSLAGAPVAPAAPDPSLAAAPVAPAAPAKPGEVSPDAVNPPVYGDFKIPEGVNITQESLAHFKETVGAKGLDQAGAQQLLDLHIKDLQEANSAPYKLWEDTQKAWREESKNDSVFGGAKFNENLGNIAKAIDAVYDGNPMGAKAFRDALNFTGAGNNPAVLNFLHYVAQAYIEGSPATGGKSVQVNSDGSKGVPSAANTLYPNQSETKLANSEI